jgi:hypothetical protein
VVGSGNTSSSRVYRCAAWRFVTALYLQSSEHVVAYRHFPPQTRQSRSEHPASGQLGAGRARRECGQPCASPLLHRPWRRGPPAHSG